MKKKEEVPENNVIQKNISVPISTGMRNTKRSSGTSSRGDTESSIPRSLAGNPLRQEGS